jgi:hypothetical protein
MVTPDYVKILKLDKLALHAKTEAEFLQKAQPSLHQARVLGVESGFSYFLEQAWVRFGNGQDADTLPLEFARA